MLLLNAYSKSIAAYGVLEPSYPGIIALAGRMALENIANSDALYHDVEHATGDPGWSGDPSGKHVREGGSPA